MALANLFLLFPFPFILPFLYLHFTALIAWTVTYNEFVQSPESFGIFRPFKIITVINNI